MSFKSKFPELFQFFSGYFPDADFDNIEDEEIVAKYIISSKKTEKAKEDLERIKIELIILIGEVELYWRDISEDANRYFKDSSEALKWLLMINEEINKP